MAFAITLLRIHIKSKLILLEHVLTAHVLFDVRRSQLYVLSVLLAGLPSLGLMANFAAAVSWIGLCVFDDSQIAHLHRAPAVAPAPHGMQTLMLRLLELVDAREVHAPCSSAGLLNN